MKRTAICLVLTLLALPALTCAQTTTPPADLQNPSLQPTAAPHTASVANKAALKSASKSKDVPKPFSRIAVSGGISTGGINMQVATNVNKYLNLRGVGNYLDYTRNDIEIDSYTVNGKLNLATGGVSLDYYPFPFHGFRVSPGVQFYNDNSGYATIKINSGTKISLNDYDYYSSATNPITGFGDITLHTRKPTPTLTLGWGNLISRTGGHWSFPFEIGAAFMDTPGINVVLNGGQACDAHGLNCVDVATNPDVQSNLASQLVKYRRNMTDYKYYPILSFGVGYNFKIR